MCWKATRRSEATRRIAENDIRVYKVILRMRGGIYYSYYETKKYEVGKTYETSLAYPNEAWTIECGFHSYKADAVFFEKSTYRCFNVNTRVLVGDAVVEKTVQRYRLRASAIILDRILLGVTSICEFIVPKGASYYENKYGEIVSNKITFVREVERAKYVDSYDEKFLQRILKIK